MEPKNSNGNMLMLLLVYLDTEEMCATSSN